MVLGYAEHVSYISLCGQVVDHRKGAEELFQNLIFFHARYMAKKKAFLSDGSFTSQHVTLRHTNM